MSVAADDAGLPADPEFRSALLAYLEWGTRLAFENSQPGADPVQHAPVPRWAGGRRRPTVRRERRPQARPASGRHTIAP